MFKKILIANRGEIAVRVMRACRMMGIQTVAIFSDADRNSLHVMLADEAYGIGGNLSTESYLNMNKVLEVVRRSKAEAVHPGYGFLSENKDFVEALNQEGVVFIGATAKNISDMGDKLRSRELMRKAGVPVVQGSDGTVESVDEAQAVGKKIGFPVIIKASSGGGGKGIRVVHEASELASAFRACRSEGKNYFNDDRVFIEQFIQSPKHIEIQVFGDSHGQMAHLFERECSVQRRHQKLIEETPSPSVPPDVRQRMGEVSVAAAKAIGYLGAGTMEFIFDNKTKDFFFMEMNTRLQVEHPVTEMTTGFDLVQEQILVAAGKKLSFTQEQVKSIGHAIELRICAEDPETFAPAPGRIRSCRVPQGPCVRVDGAIYSGYEVPIYYDPMLAKLVAWGKNRSECIGRLKAALAEFFLTGVKSNLPLHRAILEHPKFLDGSYTTQFIAKHLSSNESKKFFTFVDEDAFVVAAAIEAYKNARVNDVSEQKLARQWRKIGRVRQLRGPF